MKLGIGGHQTTGCTQDEWLTPPAILKALGPFDLDPCAPVIRPWDMATHHYTVNDDGLSEPWFGRVWLNPPYNDTISQWMVRMATHGNGIALVFSRTETAFFHNWIWPKATAVFFFNGRLHFHHVDGTRSKANAGGPSVLVAYGANNVESIAASHIPGRLVVL